MDYEQIIMGFSVMVLGFGCSLAFGLWQKSYSAFAFMLLLFYLTVTVLKLSGILP